MFRARSVKNKQRQLNKIELRYQIIQDGRYGNVYKTRRMKDEKVFGMYVVRLYGSISSDRLRRR